MDRISQYLFIYFLQPNPMQILTSLTQYSLNITRHMSEYLTRLTIDTTHKERECPSKNLVRHFSPT